MRSKAHVKGHPIHPMLVGFPLSFLTGAFLCDLVGRVLESPAWWTTGAWLSLAGIGTGVLAAGPGLVDYLYSVPPRSSARRRATYHMIVNLGALGLFVAAWVIRGRAAAAPGLPGLTLEAAGLVLLGMGGWMGGTLVVRNFIGPEHRYAQTGRWSEQVLDARPGAPVTVAGAQELKPDQMKLLHINGKRIVLARTGDTYVAFDDFCSHRGGSLADGVLMCGTVQCLWHGSQFDVKTGQVRAGPAEKPIATYQVQVDDNVVRLTL